MEWSTLDQDLSGFGTVLVPKQFYAASHHNLTQLHTQIPPSILMAQPIPTPPSATAIHATSVLATALPPMVMHHR